MKRNIQKANTLTDPGLGSAQNKIRTTQGEDNGDEDDFESAERMQDSGTVSSGRKMTTSGPELIPGVRDDTEDDVVIEDPNSTDNRKRQFLYLTAILSYLALGVMILSIIAADNFGENNKESFEMQMDSERPSINRQVTYNAQGFKLISKCDFQRYFTQGIEVLEDQEHLMLSSGWRKTSKLVLIKFDLDTCTFNEEIVKNMES